jgi:hypothetical protein
LSGVLRAKADYRVIGTFVGGAAMVAIVPNLVDAPELEQAVLQICSSTRWQRSSGPS